MKKILFLNTTKLAVLSAMLLLAVFCTIGMSFTPAEEGENVGNPNDSTYVTGPRRGHWKTTDNGCNSDTYSGTKDYSVIYAEVVVFNTNGEDITGSVGDVSNIGVVKIEKVNDDACLGQVTANNGEDIKTQLEWNCNIEESEQKKQDSDISKKHQLKIKLTATDKGPTDDYAFVGWTINKTKLDDPSQYETNPYVPTVGFPNNDGLHNYNGTQNYNPHPESNPYKITYYAHFSIAESNVVTLHPAEFGAYSCTYTDYSDPLKPTSTYEMGSTGDDGVEKEIETKGDIVLKAKPAPTYEFFGWYEEDGDNEVYFSYDQNDTISIVQTKTIYAKFIPDDAALFAVKDDETNRRFWNLNEACQFAIDNNHTVVYSIDNGTLYPLVNGELYTGEISETTEITPYTILEGVTLLIPCDNSYSCPDKPKSLDSKPALTMYRKLTLDKGVKILVESGATLYVAGHQYGATSGNPGPGQPIGAYGAIDMNQGGEIIVKGILRAYGFILGKGNLETTGTITVDGGTVYEDFIIADMHGGGGTAACVNGSSTSNEYELFPLNQYFIQNVEPKMTLKNNAKEYAIFNIDGTQQEVELVGSKNSFLFQLHTDKNPESTWTKWYDYSRDYICYEVYGEASLNSITLKVNVGITTMTFSSSEFILPITNNMDITLAENTTMHLPTSIKLLPGAKITVEKGVVVDLQKPLYIYDAEEWDRYAMGFGQAIKDIPGHTVRDVSAKDKFEDASLVVNGTINIVESGALYTTATGGDITSTGGGKIVYNQQPASNPRLYEIYGTYGKDSTSGTGLSQADAYNDNNTNIDGQVRVGDFALLTYKYAVYGTPISCNPAWLHNGEEWYKDKEDKFKNEYLATAGVSAPTTIQYANNHWGWMEIWKDHDGTILNINNTCTQTNNSSAYEHNVLPEGYTFIGWSTEVSDTNQEVIHTAQYTFGPELDIVDADNTNKTLTINATSFALSGWPYTINDVEYARPADRMLTIPYGDKDPNEEIVIEVKDKEGTVVSCNMYIVPFVYPDTEDMSAMNENSIVFVKSGTLTVDDASAKEIYVAPGAALQVNENGILTVGKLVLRTTPFDAAILTNNGTINGQVYYSRIARDADFHLFAIPAGSNTANVVLSDGSSCAVNSTTTPYGAAWQLREYNTARRAAEGATGANWDNIGVNADKTTYLDVDIEASKGYELRSGSKYYREYLFPITLPTTATEVVVVSATGAAGAAHTGWNILCSPYTGIYTVENYNDPATAIKVCWQQTDGSYIQEQPKQIKPAVPFAYQASQTGALAFDTNFTFAAPAPRKQSAAEALTETEWVHLDIFDAYGEGDETSLFVHPTRFEQTYKTGIDMAKQSLTASRAILYTTHAYGDMAFAGVADSLLENGIDLVVYSPSAQELTFSLRENKFLNRLEYLWLADNETGARTDLLMNDYTFRADAGTAKGRFVLNGRFKAPQISTGIGNTQTDYNIYAIGNNIAISGVEQGTPIYVFDAVGHMIYTTAATSDEVIVPAPCAGVYMLSVGGQTAKLVINK